MPGRNLRHLLEALDLLVRSQGVTARELADKLQVDKRSAYRLLDTMESLRFPIYKDGNRFRLDEEFVNKLPNCTVPNLDISFRELLALNLLYGTSRVLIGTDLQKTIDSVFAKLNHFLPPDLFKKMQRLPGLTVPDCAFAKDYSQCGEIIELLTDAIPGQKTCEVSYDSFHAGTLKQYSVEPLKLFEHRGGLYLFVRFPKYDSIRVLAVERIKTLKPLKETFDYPRRFDPEKLLGESFGIILDDPVEVTVRFAPNQVKYIKERRLPGEVRMTDCEDGSLEVRIKTSGRRDVLAWILGYGPDAELLAPEELRAELARMVRETAARYDSRPPECEPSSGRKSEEE